MSRTVIVERHVGGLLVLRRDTQDGAWITAPLAAEDMSTIGVVVAVADHDEDQTLGSNGEPVHA